MFSLFKKKESGSVKVTDKIWISETAKLNAFARQWDENKNTAWVFWFDDTLQKVQNVFQGITGEQPTLLTAREASSMLLQGKSVIFAEHYPLQQKETALFEKLHLKEAVIWSAMDEPLFRHFGAEKIVQLMRQLGMKEDEMIEHNMISKAIRNAQEKISKKVSMEFSASSQADWLSKNLPAHS
jgi:hypothetical protein